MKTTYLVLLAAIIVMGACNKDKRASKRFMKPGTWQVKEVSVAGNNLDTLPTWSVNSCDIYENLCTASWTRNGVSSQIHWQFNDKAQTFKISRVVPPDECENFYTELVEQQTFQYSGVYDVIESKKTRKVFESNATLGYTGQKVRIVIETELGV